MANIPGASNPLPGAYSTVTTLSRGSSVPGGIRVLCIMGEATGREEVLVASALGSGLDGFDPTYTLTSANSNNTDGRHFKTLFFPLVEGRSKLYKNGVLLTVLEDEIDTGSFSNEYDYRLDPATGQIELQTAYIINQGGSDYKPATTNVGAGTLSNITLVDLDAPTETWTIKCVSVSRDISNNPILNTAKFIAIGSVSGQKYDINNNPIYWVANNTVVSNGVISFSLLDAVTSWREGDSFSIKVKGGALAKNDSLSIQYIYTGDINDPEFFESSKALNQKHGNVSLENPLALGAQLAFANGAPGVLAMQTAPAVPRRTSYSLGTNMPATSLDEDDFIFPLPFGVTPDPDSNIHFFVKNPTTNVETQLVPNKYEFYTLDTVGHPSTSTFVFDNTLAPSGYSYSYTVVKNDEILSFGVDGYINANQPLPADAEFSSPSIEFDEDYVGMTINIENTTNPANTGSFTVTSVSNGNLIIHRLSGSFITENNVRFEIVDTSNQSDYIVVNKNIVPNGYSLRVTLITTKDASFYDAGWLQGFERLENVECDILVPLPLQTISVIFQNAISHCETMSNVENRKERVPFIGSIKGLTVTNVIGEEDAAVEDIGVLEGIQGDDVSEILVGNTEDLANYSVSTAYGSTFRCVYFYPDEIVTQVGTSNEKVAGYFAAAAAGGYFSGNNNIPEPLTNKILAGFSILRDKQFSPTTLKKLIAAGITVLQPVSGGGEVVWGKTTSQSGYPEEEEISIVFIRDRIAKTMRAGFKDFTGRAESRGTQASMTARAVSLIQSFMSQNMVTDYKDLVVVRDTVEPRQWNVSFLVQPNYPINWVYIPISVGLLL